MTAAPDQPALFIDAVEIPAFLDGDRSTPYAERLHRDRTIGASLRSLAPLARVRAWRRQQAQRGHASTPALMFAQRLNQGRRVVGLLMLIVGAIAGSGVASAVFHYDGTWPVNVVTVMAVLVLLQVALVIVTLVLMLPRIPGLRALQDVIGSISPGAVIAAIYRRVAHLGGGNVDLLAPHARGPAAARFARWQVLAWSQTAAIAFNIAALATAIALIAFTDLAFGWSTTLRIDSNEALRITNALAAPWRALWPEAVPSATLIESSRFFRLASAPPPKISAEALTGWWPFLLAAIITYGLVPRCLLFAFASFRLRSATAHLLLDDPQVKALLDRMNSTEIELGAEGAEAASPRQDASAAAAPTGGASQAAAIVWSGAIAKDSVNDWSLRQLRKQVTTTVEAGGGRNLDEDAAIIRAIADERPALVLLFVRAWEAPLLDLQDFLIALRAAVGAACSIIVVPIGAGGATAAETHRATWSRWVGRMADSGLYVETGA